MHNIRFKDFHVDWNASNEIHKYSENTSSKLLRNVRQSMGLQKCKYFVLFVIYCDSPIYSSSLLFQLPVEHSPFTSFHVFCLPLFFSLSSNFHVAISQHHVFSGLGLFSILVYSYNMPCLVKLFADFLNKRPIHLHLLFQISCSTGTC